MQNLNIFDEYILSSYSSGPHRVAIVGNSGLKEFDEENIAKCNVVVRFNDFASRSETDSNRCHILFSDFRAHNSLNIPPRDVIIGVPFPYKAQEIERELDVWYPRSNCWMVNPYENLKMNQELGLDGKGIKFPFPSLSFTALWHMRNWNCVFYVCSLDWKSETDAAFNHYNAKKELQWIAKNLATKNNFIFSDHCSSLIDACA